MTHVLSSNFDVELKKSRLLYLPVDNFFLKKSKLVQGQVKKIKVKSGVLKFWALAPGDRDYRFLALKLRRNVIICMVKVCYDYRSHTKKRTKSPSGNKNSLYVNNVI